MPGAVTGRAITLAVNMATFLPQFSVRVTFDKLLRNVLTGLTGLTSLQNALKSWPCK